MSPDAPLDDLVRKLGTRAVLQAGDRDAILALPYRERKGEAGSYLVREGATPTHCAFVRSGFTFRQKLTASGARQIVSVQIPGDLIDLQNLFLARADHNVQALTRVSVVEIPIAALREIALGMPAVALAMWVDALVDASIFREWIVNVGRRDGRTRVAHFLCEFALRMEVAGMAQDKHYELPMTQEQIGDVTGLTPVHVNRVLRALDKEGLIQRNRREVGIVDWEQMRDVGDFNQLYLHLDQIGRRET